VQQIALRGFGYESIHFVLADDCLLNQMATNGDQFWRTNGSGRLPTWQQDYRVRLCVAVPLPVWPHWDIGELKPDQEAMKLPISNVLSHAE
jgi:hypothetical protein